MSAHADKEDAAFFAFRQVDCDEDKTFIVREILPIAEHHIIKRKRHEIEIAGAALTLALYRADELECNLGFVHSHPDSEHTVFSDMDDETDEDSARTSHVRIKRGSAYASLIWSNGYIAGGRYFNRQLNIRSVDQVNVIGSTINIYPIPRRPYSIRSTFDRQTDVLPSAVQRALERMRVGVVGLGGTGSAILAQIVRLGVGNVTIVDEDTFEATNANRVHGSAVSDEGLFKSEVADRLVRTMGFGTSIRAITGNVDDEEVAKTLRDCDVIFGCTDDELGRAVLSRLSYAYLIPTFDMGVVVDPEEATIDVEARITTMLPDEACLFCRGRITSNGVRSDSVRRHNPDEAEILEREGYLQRSNARAPSVVTFTTPTASLAINELLHRLIQIYGDGRTASEVLYRLTAEKISRNRQPKRPGCFCGDPTFVGFGDMNPFLDRSWEKRPG